MKKKQWKKILLVAGVLFLLVFTFWYGGNAPGLQGFSIRPQVEESTSVQEGATNAVTEQKAQEETEVTEVEDSRDKNIFQEIIMHVTKKESTSGTSNKAKNKATNSQVQKNKKSQKNANKTTKKETKKKSTAQKTDDGENEKNITTTEAKKDDDLLTCTVFISCATVLDNIDRLPAEKKKIIPADGVVLKEVKVDAKKNSTVFDVLQMVTKENKIHLEYAYTPLYKNYYIEGINNLYEFDCGNGSGWLYSVNDEFPSEGCSACEVKDGDVIKWLYTCDFGEDVGKYYKED